MADNMTLRIAEVRALDKAATAGPWEVRSDGRIATIDNLESFVLSESIIAASAYPGQEGMIFCRKEDAALIARYRTLAPALANDLERVIAQRDSFRDHLAIAYRAIEEAVELLGPEYCGDNKPLESLRRVLNANGGTQ